MSKQSIFSIAVVALALSFSNQLSAQDEGWDDAWDEEEKSGFEWHGFIEGAAGFRFQNDTALEGKEATLADLRLRLETSYALGNASISLKADGWYDGVTDDLNANIRDLTLSLPITTAIDLKVGRQVLTWGTGDYLFINDQFSKNWQAFFSGQTDEYLKGASNSIKASWYKGNVSLNVVWTPIFEPDVYINGERFSFFSPQLGQNIAPNFTAIVPDKGIVQGELAARIKIQKNSTEFAFYGYRGYSGTPVAINPLGQPAFAKSQTFGASVLRPLGKGLFNAEFGYQESLKDQNISFIDKQLKFLVGYEQEIMKSFTVSGQYYLEYLPDHDSVVASMVSNGILEDFAPDKARHVLTLRSTYRSNHDNTTWSLFTFYSPSDKDIYLRPSASHRLNDAWTVALGANIFLGEKNNSFFGQFKKSSNGYIRLRYGF